MLVSNLAQALRQGIGPAIESLRRFWLLNLVLVVMIGGPGSVLGPVAGAIVVGILPEFLSSGFKVQSLPWIGPSLDAILPKFFTQGFGFNFYFGGTSLLIVVGVAMDTVQQIESKLVEHHYTGFLKKSRIRGRRG